MKKLLTGAVVSTAAVLLVGPFATGFYVENLHDEFMANLQEKNPAFKIEKTEYKRGWFNSDAKYTYSLGAIPSEEGEEPTPIEMELTTRSHHGPLPFTALQDDDADFAFGLATLEYRGTMDEFLKVLNVTTDGLPDFVSSGHISYGGRYHFDCDIEAGEGSITIEPEPEESETLQLSWQATQCGGATKLRSGNGDFAMQAPELVISGIDSDDEKRMVFTDASLEGDVVDGDSDLPLTNFDMKIGNVVVSSPEMGGEFLTLGDIQVFGKGSKDDDQIDFDLAYRIGNVESPVVSGKDFFIEFGLANVDRSAAVKLREEYQRFNVAMMDANAAMAGAQDPEEIMAVYEQTFGKEALLKLLPELAKFFDEAEFSLGFGELKTNELPVNIGTINGFSAKLFSTNVSEGVPLGGYEVKLAGWDFVADENLAMHSPFKSLAIKNLSVTDRAEADGETLRLRSIYAADKLMLNDMNFSDVKFGSTLGGFDKAIADKIFGDFVAAVSEIGIKGADPQAFLQSQDPEVLLNQMQTLFESARLSLDDFGFSTADGRADLKGDVTLKNLDFSQMTSPMDLLGVVSAALDLKLDKGLVKNVIDMAVNVQAEGMPEDMDAEQKQEIRGMMRDQFSGMMAGLIEQGLIEETQEGYKSKARFDEATLKVNGEEMPLPF